MIPSPQTPSLFTRVKRDFWALFAAIWLCVGVMFLVIGTVLALRDHM